MPLSLQSKTLQQCCLALLAFIGSKGCLLRPVGNLITQGTLMPVHSCQDALSSACLLSPPCVELALRLRLLPLSRSQYTNRQVGVMRQVLCSFFSQHIQFGSSRSLYLSILTTTPLKDWLIHARVLHGPEGCAVVSRNKQIVLLSGSFNASDLTACILLSACLVALYSAYPPTPAHPKSLHGSYA